MSEICKFNCSRDNSFTVYFKYTNNDFVNTPGSSILTFYNYINSGFGQSATYISNYKFPLEIKAGSNMFDIDVIENNVSVPPIPAYIHCDITINNYEWLYVAYILATFRINPARLCDVNFIMSPNKINPTELQIQFTIGPPISTSNPGTPNIASLYPLDTYSSECIANVFLKWVTQYDLTEPKNIKTWISQNGLAEVQKCDSFTSSMYNEIQYIPDIINKSLGKFSDIKLLNNSSKKVIEQLSGGVLRGTSKPTTVLEYIFTYSYPISFIGAISYCILSSLQIEISSIISNKNLTSIISIYIFLCGLFSMCIYLNYDFINDSDFKIGDFKMKDYFNLATIKLSNK